MGVELWLVRHGETEWSLSGAHTSKTDIPLTGHGRKRAEELRGFLEQTSFARVWIGLEARVGQKFALGTGSVSVLGWERSTRVISHWNRGFEA